MVWCRCTLLSVMLLGCSTAEPPARRTLPVATKEQGDVLKRADRLFATGGKEFFAVVDEAGADPATTKAMVMYLAWHMNEAARLQRQRQQGTLPVRALDSNARYVQARTAIARLGPKAVPPVGEVLVEHRFSDSRWLGVEILAAMGPEVLPTIEKSVDQRPEKFRRYYVEAVGRMAPTAEAERLLLAWTGHSDFTVRAAAYVGLASHGAKHLAKLHAAVRSDPDRFVQRQVVKQLGAFRDKETARVVIEFYSRSVVGNDRMGETEAERALVRISGREAARGRKVIRYGLASWQEWYRNLPPGGAAERGR